MKLVQFGHGSQVYTFPDQADYSDNFGDLVQRTQRLPGLSGGYRQVGQQASAKEIGSVRVGFHLLTATAAQMQTALDDLYKTQGFGLKRLFMREWQDPATYRWTEAEVSSILTPHNVRSRPERVQRVEMTFQCPDPYWYEIGSESWSWGDAVLWGDGEVWGGGAVPVNLPNLTNNFTEVVAGNVHTYPRLTLTVPGGGSVTNPVIQRLNGSVVMDEVRYTGTIGASSVLDINCRNSKVRLNGANAFTNAFDYLRASFFRLEPGSNSIRVTFAAKTGAPTLQIRYYTRW